MLLFHGTPALFDTFLFSDEYTRHENYGKAIYFSDNYDIAKYYGDRVIEIDLPTSEITQTVNAQGRGMKHVLGIRDSITAGGIIAVENINDSNLEGAQCKRFEIDTTSFGDYSYFVEYVLPIEHMSKKAAEKVVNIMKECGLTPYMLYDKWLRKYHIYLVDYLISEERIFQAIAKGVRFEKLMRKTPASSTTVIFAGDRGIDLLNRLYRKEKGLVL